MIAGESGNLARFVRKKSNDRRTRGQP